MTSISFKRVTAVPSSVDADTLYFVTEGANHFSIYTKDTATNATRRIPTVADIEAKIASSIASLSAVQVVANITARNALTISANTLVVVTDATGDSTVTSGAALYVGKVDGSTTTWTKLSEFESMDVTLSWANITGKPTSAVADIDDAVTKRHAHTNMTQLGKVGENASGKFTYNGSLPSIGWDVSSW